MTPCHAFAKIEAVPSDSGSSLGVKRKRGKCNWRPASRLPERDTLLEAEQVVRVPIPLHQWEGGPNCLAIWQFVLCAQVFVDVAHGICDGQGVRERGRVTGNSQDEPKDVLLQRIEVRVGI